MTTVPEQIMLLCEKIKNEINCTLPARVTQVNEDGTVNVVAIRNDEIKDCVITVPVLRPETQRAYIQLKIAPGDRGVLKFCDKSIEEYRKGDEAYNGDDRMHSISDGIFQLGFLPSNEKFIFPDGEIVVGLKNKTFTLSVDANGNLTMNTQNITIKSQDISVTSNNVVINASQTDATTPVNITGDINISGNVSVTGKIDASDTITSQLDVMALNISLKTHTHGGVMGGQGSTGVPQ